jgi:hypothetical protein
MAAIICANPAALDRLAMISRPWAGNRHGKFLLRLTSH